MIDLAALDRKLEAAYGRRHGATVALTCGEVGVLVVCARALRELQQAANWTSRTNVAMEHAVAALANVVDEEAVVYLQGPPVGRGVSLVALADGLAAALTPDLGAEESWDELEREEFIKRSTK